MSITLFRKSFSFAVFVFVGLQICTVAFAKKNELSVAPRLGAPVDCVMNKECFIQQYVDMGKGDAIQDPFCRTASYQKHTGTDFRVKDLPQMLKGVSVIAAQDGEVVGARDGMADKLIRSQQDRVAIKGKECGNGVLIRHREGWVTQYCHLKKGSIKVEKGQNVKKGDVLGLIGLSGLTEFPHLEFVVRQGNQVIDPFSGRGFEQGCSQDFSSSLWSKKARQILPRQGTLILDAGFSKKGLSRLDLLKNSQTRPPQKGDRRFILWGRVMNMAKGDRILMSLRGPDGVHIQRRFKPHERNQALFVPYIGSTKTVQAGLWLGSVSILRNGKIIRRTSFSHMVKE